jgi:hypothetical protein
LERTARASAIAKRRFHRQVGCWTQRVETNRASEVVGGEGHIGGGKSGVGKDGWEGGVEERREGGGEGSGEAEGPEVDNDSREPEEGEHGEACRREGAIVVAAGAEESIAFFPEDMAAGPVNAGEFEAEGGGDAGQGRVLVLKGVVMSFEPLHAGAEVGGFVDGVTEDGVGGCHAKRRDQEEGGCGERAEEGWGSGHPEAGQFLF